jgi:hypothetical protein
MTAAVPSIEKATQGIKISGVLEFLKHSPTKLLIGGKWLLAQSGKTFEPSTLPTKKCWRW